MLDVTVKDPWMYVAIIAIGLLAWIARLVIRRVLNGDLVPGALMKAKDLEIEAKNRELTAIKSERIEERKQFTVLAAETVPMLNVLVAAIPKPAAPRTAESEGEPS